MPSQEPVDYFFALLWMVLGGGIVTAALVDGFPPKNPNNDPLFPFGSILRYSYILWPGILLFARATFPPKGEYLAYVLWAHGLALSTITMASLLAALVGVGGDYSHHVWFWCAFFQAMGFHVSVLEWVCGISTLLVATYQVRPSLLGKVF